MEAFDGCAIAPMMGCSSATAYYTEASCESLLHQVRTPLLFVSAANDPIASADIIKRDVFRTATEAPLLLAVTKEGGHSMVWPEGWRGMGRAWSIDVLVEFIRQLQKSAE